MTIVAINDTAVLARWVPSNDPAVRHFTVSYTGSVPGGRRQLDPHTGDKQFPPNAQEGVVGGLNPDLVYLFEMTVTFILNGSEVVSTPSPRVPPSEILLLVWKYFEYLIQ